MNQIELLRHVADNLEAGRETGEGLLIDGLTSNATSVSGVRWNDSECYTLAPRTHTVNSFVVPAPMDVEPDKNSPFFAIALSSKNLTPCYKWYGDSEDITLFRRGVCFHTQEAAQQNALAMLGRDPAKGVDGV